jgi:hypothetical protein
MVWDGSHFGCSGVKRNNLTGGFGGASVHFGGGAS